MTVLSASGMLIEDGQISEVEDSPQCQCEKFLMNISSSAWMCDNSQRHNHQPLEDPEKPD
jgi:hypothetical protein